MGIDAAYALTRRRGLPAVVSRVTNSTANAETGAITDTVTSTTVRRVVKEPTRYGRLYRANATQQDIGETTFIFWLEDISFTKLDQEDYITQDGIRYDVVTSAVEETALVVTAREMVR
jgi:hypothetical protein